MIDLENALNIVRMVWPNDVKSLSGTFSCNNLYAANDTQAPLGRLGKIGPLKNHFAEWIMKTFGGLKFCVSLKLTQNLLIKSGSIHAV